MRYNVKRSVAAEKMIHTNERYQNNNDNLGDAILDFLHYASHNGVDFDKELEYARNAFKEDGYSLTD